jgi:hypothetical protein
MSNVLFRCPKTGMNVQHFVGEPSSEKKDGRIVVVNCPACTGIHFVNTATGGLASDTRKR